MRTWILTVFLFSLFLSSLALAQVTESATVAGNLTNTDASAVPHYVRFSGAAPGAPAGSVGATFALYADQHGGSPLWLETQNVDVDASGHYSVLLGASKKDGIPAELFASGQARWLGVKLGDGGEAARVLLVSVPYALKAGDAETLGGLPASAFVLAPLTASNVSSDPTATTATAPATGVRAAAAPLAGSTSTANYIPVFTDSSGSLANSNLFQSAAGNIGIGYNNPVSRLVIVSTDNQNIVNASNAVDQDMQIQLSAPHAVDKFAYFGASTPTNLVLGVNGERMRITAAGWVGIGTSQPSSPLTVTGTIQSTIGGFKFPDGSVLSSANNNTNVGTSVTYNGTTSDQIFYAVQNQVGNQSSFLASGVPAGVRGDSITNSGYAAGVFGSASSPLAPGVAGVNLSTCPVSGQCNAYGVFGWSVVATNGAGVWGQADATTGANNVGTYGESKGDSGTGVEGYANSTTGDGTGVYGLTIAPSGAGVWGDSQATSGSNIGVYGSVKATSGIAGQFDAPTNGTIFVGRSGSSASMTKVVRIDSTGKGFFNGGTQTGGADFAESVDVVGGAAQYEPGDVMMIDENGTRRLALAEGAYSTKVAGIYSTKPGVLATPHTMDDPRIANEVPLAIVGIVPCKVSTENGSIHAGDLLVVSSHAGYAMKGTDRDKMMGAVVGKALGSIDKGAGTIEVLVSLH